MTVGSVLIIAAIGLAAVWVLLGEREYRDRPRWGRGSAYGMAFLLTTLVAIGVLGVIVFGAIIAQTWAIPLW